MFTKHAALACLATLSLVGCGAPVEEAVPEAALDNVEQPLLYMCDGSRAFTRYWYEDGVEVGREYCDCDGNLTQYGEEGGLYKQVVHYYCY
jgi:hypothetical protein